MRVVCLAIVVFLVGCGSAGKATLTTGAYSHGPSHRISPRRGPERSPRTRSVKRIHARGQTAARCRELLPAIETVSRAHGVDSALVVGVIRVESRFKPTALSRAGATGLMQVMPSTGKWFKCGDLTDPADNLDCGVRILKRYLARYGGDLTYGVSAYHAGPKWSDRSRKQGVLPKNFSYVEKVLHARARYLRHGCW
ncbi:MAG TPA: lytic transglycosylase domain-containing protein [Myxococcales bacterium]|nr:lytic transglycosylase domain-containing protein [Myxococcales bacterium]